MQRWINNSKNKKGVSSLEIVIGLLIFLIVFCFLLDLLILIQKFNVVAQTNTQIARIAGIQGGVLHSFPPSYPGGSSNYINISEINNIVKEKFSLAGIKDNEWIVNIGNGKIGKNGISATQKYDYKESFSTEIIVDYKWVFMSNILPGDLKQTIRSKRPTMSEWKYNYDSWIGE